MSDVALRFGARDDGLTAQFNKTGKDLDALQGKVSKAGAAISGSFGKIAAAAAAIGFGKLVGDALEFADQLEAASVRTGISVEGLQRLQFTASQTSGDLGTLTAAVGRMQVQLNAAGEGSNQAAAALARLHIPVNDFVSLKPDEQFEKVAVAISNLVDPAERTAAAVGLFGKSGAELLPVLVSTGTELAKVSAQFEGIGGAVSADAIGKVDDLGDSFAALKLGITSLTTELVAVFAPAITDAIQSVEHFIAGLRLIDGKGSNAVVNLDNKVRDLQSTLKRFETLRSIDDVFGIGKTSSQRTANIIILQHQIDGLINSERELLELNKSPLAQLPLPNPDLVRLPTVADGGEKSVQQTRLDALSSNNNPVVIAKLQEKDLLLKINQETTDAMLRQETDLATARISLTGNTQATLLDMTEAFTGQIIDFARFRADFEQNAAVATLALAGQVLGQVFGKNKAVAIAQATISTIAGVVRALQDYPYPYSLAIGGLVAASGLSQISKIKSTNVNGGGGGSIGSSVGGGVSSAPSRAVTSPISAPPAKERGVMQININGPITGEQSMRWLVDRLRENIGDFDLVLNRVGR